MPKRKAAAVVAPVAETESSESADEEPVVSPKKGKDSTKKAPRGRGRPPLSSEEKAKRETEKATKPVRGRGRPKGSGSPAAKTKGSKKK